MPESRYGRKPNSVPNGTQLISCILFLLPICSPYGADTKAWRKRRECATFNLKNKNLLKFFRTIRQWAGQGIKFVNLPRRQVPSLYHRRNSAGGDWDFASRQGLHLGRNKLQLPHPPCRRYGICRNPDMGANQIAYLTARSSLRRFCFLPTCSPYGTGTYL